MVLTRGASTSAMYSPMAIPTLSNATVGRLPRFARELASGDLLNPHCDTSSAWSVGKLSLALLLSEAVNPTCMIRSRLSDPERDSMPLAEPNCDWYSRRPLAGG